MNKHTKRSILSNFDIPPEFKPLAAKIAARAHAHGVGDKNIMQHQINDLRAELAKYYTLAKGGDA